jgi:hypothetical protein
MGSLRGLNSLSCNDIELNIFFTSSISLSGTDGRYRGKLPLICINCDGIDHFSNKCAHIKKRNYEGYSK